MKNYKKELKKLGRAFQKTRVFMPISHFDKVVALSELKQNPAKVVRLSKILHKPVLLTSKGQDVAVLQGLDNYTKTAEELRFVKAVATGLSDIALGHTLSLEETCKLLIDES
ncbi:type II toxin-antitoxin system Phd/YefM family antitoxin [Rheinheimera soli]|uniref:Antitoxin n=1 Tax=Rheinheimera soli TaxID=443616 RepID=A0ABU1VXG1_9GAMM|nr:type II toxin-antitoxin system Phd/YefM family antitoxin [Rheinheimera soli]MDR7120410.1 prevent-host-death family protein [Rheinheimera soli]